MESEIRQCNSIAALEHKFAFPEHFLVKIWSKHPGMKMQSEISHARGVWMAQSTVPGSTEESTGNIMKG